MLIQVPLDRLSIEVCPIMELDAFPERKGDSFGSCIFFKFRGEPRHGLTSFVDTQKRFYGRAYLSKGKSGLGHFRGITNRTALKGVSHFQRSAVLWSLVPQQREAVNQ